MEGVIYFLENNLVLIPVLMLLLLTIALGEFVIPRIESNKTSIKAAAYVVIIALAIFLIPILTNSRAELMNRPAVSVSVQKLDSQTAQSLYGISGGNTAYIVNVANPESSYEIVKQLNLSIYFNGKSGMIERSNGGHGYSGKGEIVSYGYTSFIAPIAFHMQDSLVLNNYSNSKYITSSANVPISIVNNPGTGAFFSSYLLDLQGSNSSITGNGETTLVMNVSKMDLNHLYVGEFFTYFDLFGNAYPAMVTGLTLLNFTYSISSNYASQINHILYEKFNGSANANYSHWNFSAYPFRVSLINNTLEISSTSSFVLFSAGFEYLQIYVYRL